MSTLGGAPTPFAWARRGEVAPLVTAAEWGASFLILVLMSQALLGPVFAPDQNPDNVPWLRSIWLPVYGAIALMIAADPLRMSRVAPAAAMSLVLVGWAFASSRWSIDSEVTVRRSVALLMTSLFGLQLAARWSWRGLAELVASVYLLLAFGSYIACLLFPGFAVHHGLHEGAWKGLWYEKNQMGGIMVHGVLACAVAAILAADRRRAWAGAAVLCLGLVVLSRSTTSLLGSGIALGGLAAIWALRRGGAWAVATVWAAALGAGGVVGLLTLSPETFFALLGKDPTLTGRTDIWAALFHRIAVRPWLGYGFGAFWNDPWGPAWFVRHEVDWTAPNAHDGWLDVLVQMGAVGLILTVGHFLASAAMAVGRIPRGPEAYWAVLYVALFLLFSISESTIMQYNGISWVMYTAITAKLFEWRGFVGSPVPRRPARLFPKD